jgi:hypothetical protein
MENIGVAILSITQGFAAFSLFMPKLEQVQAGHAGDLALVHRVRMGEIAGGAVTLGVGAIISAATKSSGPILIGAVVAAGFVGLYETTLHKISGVVANIDNTVADVSTPHVNRNESGSLRTPYPYGDEIHYDIGRSLATLGNVPIGSEATVTTGEAGPEGTYAA